MWIGLSHQRVIWTIDPLCQQLLSAGFVRAVICIQKSFYSCDVDKLTRLIVSFYQYKIERRWWWPLTLRSLDHDDLCFQDLCWNWKEWPFSKCEKLKMVKLVKIKIRMLMRVIVTWSSHLAANPGDGSGGKQVVSSSAKMRLHFIAHWEITLLGEFLNIGWQHPLKTGTEKSRLFTVTKG